MFPVIVVAVVLLLAGFLFMFGMHLMKKLDSFLDTLNTLKEKEETQGEEIQ
ncbi:MAG: hypothetical protein ACI4F1_01715 [Bariatricus sp.]